MATRTQLFHFDKTFTSGRKSIGPVHQDCVPNEHKNSVATIKKTMTVSATNPVNDNKSGKGDSPLADLALNIMSSLLKGSLDSHQTGCHPNKSEATVPTKTGPDYTKLAMDIMHGLSKSSAPQRDVFPGAREGPQFVRFPTEPLFRDDKDSVPEKPFLTPEAPSFVMEPQTKFEPSFQLKKVSPVRVHGAPSATFDEHLRKQRYQDLADMLKPEVLFSSPNPPGLSFARPTSRLSSEIKSPSSPTTPWSSAGIAPTSGRQPLRFIDPDQRPAGVPDTTQLFASLKSMCGVMPQPQPEPKITVCPMPTLVPTIPKSVEPKNDPKPDDNDLIESVLSSMFSGTDTTTSSSATNPSVVMNLLLDMLNEKSGQSNGPVTDKAPEPKNAEPTQTVPEPVVLPVQAKPKICIADKTIILGPRSEQLVAEEYPGIDSTKDAMYYLKLAVSRDDKSIMRYVISSTDFLATRQQVRQILCTMIKHENLEFMVEWDGYFRLTAKDIHANRNEALRCAIMTNNIDICKWLVKTTGFTAQQARADDNILLRKAARVSLDMCRWVCETFGLSGEDIKSRNCQAIVRAGNSGDIPLVTYLASRLAMPTATTSTTKQRE